MIYIAAPYSSPLPETIKYRMAKVTEFTVRCINRGIIVYSPLVSWHHVSTQYNLATDAEAWARVNIEFLRHCETVFCLDLFGWETSKGVALELNVARVLNIEVAHFDDEFELVPVN